MSTLKGKSILGWSIGILLVGTTLLVMFPPEMSFLKKGAEYAVYIMLSFFVMGMTLMIVDQKKLMFLTLACTAALCIFLKSSSNTTMMFPERNNLATVSIAHINLSYIDEGYEELIDIVNSLNPEILSFQEITPDWDFILRSNLSTTYPSRYSMVRIDPYGMAIYSKREIIKIDTFMFGDVPNLQAEFNIDNQPMMLMSSYLLPPLNRTASEKMKNHLKLISERATGVDWPMFVLGDYNLVPWSNEVRDFRENTNLLFSRRNIAISKFQIPYDHIMYNNFFECINFQEIEDDELNHIGIFGTYQLSSSASQIAKTNH